MRILIATPVFSPGTGGIEVNAELLAGAFAQSGDSVRVATLTKETGDREWKYPVFRSPSTSTLWQLYRWAEVVLLNHYSGRLGWPLVWQRRPVLLAVRTWLPPDARLPWLARVVRRIVINQARLLANSQAIAADLPKQAVVVGNPYRANLFHDRPEIPRTLPLLYVGRLVSDKGVDLLLHALAKRAVLDAARRVAQADQWHGPLLRIVGDGPEREPLVQLTRELSLTREVEFLGNQPGEEVARAMNAAKVLVIPSRWREPFGNIALEGIASGCVVVATRDGGLVDAVGDCGLLVARGEVEPLAAGISRALCDSELPERFRSLRQDHLAPRQPEVVATRYREELVAATADRNHGTPHV